VLLTCVSCTQLKTVPSPEVNAQRLVGHQIRVTTVDGRTLQFLLETVTNDALVGAPETRIIHNRAVVVTERVRLDEVARVEQCQVDFAKTAGVVAVLAALGLVLLGVVVARSMSSMGL
jgi:hypothetical protein